MASTVRSRSSSKNHEGSGDVSSSTIKDTNVKCGKRRHRGKRRPRKAKENRRRVRPGKSRSGFVSIGAPFNDNTFLISQRNFEAEHVKAGNSCCEMPSYLSRPCVDDNDQKLDSFEKAQALDLPTHKLEGKHVQFGFDSDSWSWTSGSIDSYKSAETSDYSSLNSPVDSSTSACLTIGEDDAHSSIKYSDEIFDEEFERRNFEAEYVAQQQELREELMKLPRCDLEDRYFMLLDQSRVLEEEREERTKMQELELEVRRLEEENRQLRAKTAHSDTRNPEDLHRLMPFDGE